MPTVAQTFRDGGVRSVTTSTSESGTPKTRPSRRIRLPAARPADTSDERLGGSWTLWETLARKHADFGTPSAFNGNVAQSRWMSFTVTMHDPLFFDLMERFTGNVAGTGGLVTFTDSSWLMSVVLAHQPHFIGQPDDVQVFWGYGLFVDQPGDFVKKKMSECTGEDLLRELLGHLRLRDAGRRGVYRRILRALGTDGCLRAARHR